MPGKSQKSLKVKGIHCLTMALFAWHLMAGHCILQVKLKPDRMLRRKVSKTIAEYLWRRFQEASFWPCALSDITVRTMTSPSPRLSSDGKYLFFASNMPGGQGGSDLYYCEYVNGEWAEPVSLGPEVNSPGAENYPYYHPSGRLFFTSDRSGGFGNLDIYYTSFVKREMGRSGSSA